MSNDDSQTSELSQDELSRAISDLGVPVHTHNALGSIGIFSIGDLIKRSEAEILAIPNLGRNHAYELIQVLSKKGYSLQEDEQPNSKGSNQTGSWRITPVDIIFIGIILYRPFAPPYVDAILWLIAFFYFAIKVYNSQDLNKKERVVWLMIVLVSTVGPWIVGPVTQIYTLTNIVGIASLWLYVLLLLSFFLYKLIACIKSKRRETVLWYLLIVTILFLPIRSALLEHRVEAFKVFAINLQHKCKQASDCSRESDFPWTIGKVVETKWSRNQAFSFHIEDGPLANGFTGGVNRELFYIHGLSEDQPVGQYWCSQRYKYVDGKWIEHECDGNQ